MSTDLKLATVYVMPLGGKAQDQIVTILERHKKYLRTEVAHQVNLKYAPEIRFRVDESFANAAKIDALLQTAKVAQDLAAPAQDLAAPAQDDSEDDQDEDATKGDDAP
jgi:ribosome-binding factor A